MSTPSGSDMYEAARRRAEPRESCRRCGGSTYPRDDAYPRDWCPLCGSVTHLVPEHYRQIRENHGLCPNCWARRNDS